MASRIEKIMMGQYKKAVTGRNEYIKFSVDESNCMIWYVLIHSIAGDNDEFVGGEYIFKMVAPDDFPYNAPKFYAMTPNGVYAINAEVCISIGHFHKDSHVASLGMSGFANQLMNGMVSHALLGHGISLLTTDDAEKRKLAADSRRYNAVNLREINARFSQ